MEKTLGDREYLVVLVLALGLVLLFFDFFITPKDPDSKYWDFLESASISANFLQS